jgi:hypothetical protein
MVQSLRKMLKEESSKLENDLRTIHEDANILPFGKKDILREKFDKSTVDVLQQTLALINNLINHINKSRHDLLQIALSSLSEEQMIKVYKEINDANTEKRDINFNILGVNTPNSWAGEYLMYYELTKLLE